jgi:high-affinity iron transporter
MNGFSAALQSGTILLREGLEALLVFAALAAFVKRAGVPEKARPIYGGAALAVVASFGAAVLFELFFEGKQIDFVESGVMAVAAALMLYVSGWLFLRQDPKVWMNELRQHAARALTSGTAVSLGVIAFLAVVREGGETILLFLHALATSSGGWSVGLLSGLIGAGACLAVIFYAMQKLALMLPLRPLFLVTSAFLFLMGLRFVGGAIQELQEQTVISYTAVKLPAWVESIGVNPTWEAIGTQLIIAITAAISMLALRLRQPQSSISTQ